MVVLFGCFGLMTARLVVLQVVEFPRYAALAADYRERVIVLPAQRGSIYDRDGDSLAVTVDLQAVIADPTQVTDVPKEAAKLARVLDMRPRKVARALEGAAEGSHYSPVAHEVDDDAAAKVDDLELDGITLVAEPKRIYPGGRLASHILGFVNDYGDALEGIESEFDGILKGKPGKIIQEQDPYQRALPQVGYTEVPAVPGRSLFLTIDKEIQYFTEQTLAAAAKEYRAESGTAIVIRVSTGEILAMANVPDFDPNNFSDFDADERRNRAVTDNFEPGSVFKVVTAAAALEENIATPDTVYSVPDSLQVSDRVIHDSHSHPEENMTFTDVIADSSNVGTVQIGIALGKELLDSWVRRFGFGKETGLDFPGEAHGIVLDPDKWYGSTISQIPMGQGIAVTSIQLVSAYAAVGNGGMWVEPKLVHATLDSEGTPVQAAPPARRRVLSRTTAREVLDILSEVVERGTGIEAAVPGYAVAGKTGTAQKPLSTGGYGNSYIASFAGIAPADHPNIAVLVSFDDPSPIWGGSTAAPTFQKIVEFTLRHLGVPPTANPEKDLEDLRTLPEEPLVHD